MYMDIESERLLTLKNRAEELLNEILEEVLKIKYGYDYFEATRIVHFLNLCTDDPMGDFQKYLNLYVRCFGMEQISKKPSLQFIKHNLGSYQNRNEILNDMKLYTNCSYLKAKKLLVARIESSRYCPSLNSTEKINYIDRVYCRYFQIYYLALSYIDGNEKETIKSNFETLFDIEFVKNKNTRLAYSLCNALLEDYNIYRTARKSPDITPEHRTMAINWYKNIFDKLKDDVYSYVTLLQLGEHVERHSDFKKLDKALKIRPKVLKNCPAILK